MNWDYIVKHVNQFNRLPCGVSVHRDDTLYRIGSNADVLTPEDCEAINYHQQGWLTPEQRYRVLNWLVCQDEIEIQGDLALLIFGREQLEEWLERSQQAYPDFEFYLAFEFQPSHESGFDSGINFTMHWVPQVGAPEPDVELDFPWKSYWESGEMFWTNYEGSPTNQLDFNLYVYPNQQSFTRPGWICSEGDRYTTPSDEEADLMSVAQVLEHFLISA
jgi:hypothetical protein